MKIVFLSYYNDVDLSTLGFIKKDLDKIACLNLIDGVECLAVTFSRTIEADKWVDKTHLVKKVTPIKNTKYFNNIRYHIHLMKEVDAFLSTQKFDAILCRYDLATYPLYKITKKYNRKFFFEHNSMEYKENALRINERRAKLKFSIKPGYFIYLYEGKIRPLFNENFFGPMLRKNVKSGFAVTNEIADYQKKIQPNYNVKVVTNGVLYDKSLVHQPPVYDGTILKMFILLGTKASWHGVDRLITGLSKYTGNVNIQIDVIGYYSDEDKIAVLKSGLQNNIHFIEPLAKNQLDERLNNYHIAIGTLGLHRKFLSEATTLKVRESLMRGFPIILSYKDTDFIVPSEVNQFILQLPSNDTFINFNDVVNFSNKVLVVKNYPLLIHDLAKPKIDFIVKAIEIVEFIKECNLNSKL